MAEIWANTSENIIRFPPYEAIRFLTEGWRVAS